MYIALFESNLSDETFIKIGVSSNGIKQRFSADIKNYNITLLKETNEYDDADSFIIESNFHTLLYKFKYNPILRLNSGNTECFVDTEECIEKIDHILTMKKKPKYNKYDNNVLNKSRKERKINNANLKKSVKKKEKCRKEGSFKKFKDEARLANRLRNEKIIRLESPISSGKRYTKF